MKLHLYQPENETARQQFWAETRTTIATMIRPPALIFIGLIPIFALEDWFASRADFIPLLIAKIIMILVLIAGLKISTSTWGQTHAEWVPLGIYATLLALVVYQSALAQIFIVPFGTMFIAVIFAILVPWHIRYHIIFALISIAAILAAAFYLGDQQTLTLGHVDVAALAYNIATIFLALYMSDRRFVMWQTEGALRESEERFRQLAEDSRDIVWIWTPDRKILYVSPAYQHFTGESPDKLYRNPLMVLKMVAPEERIAFARAIEDIIHGEFRKMDLHVRHKDGTLYWLEGWGSPILDQQGNVVRCIALWRDITDRVHLIQELNAYAHTVAHDLKTPLNVVLGYGELLEEELGPQLSGAHRQLLHTIYHTTRKMSGIIDALLMLASVRDMSSVPVDILDMRQITHNAQERLRQHIEEKRARVILPDQWPAAIGYAPWIEEIWVNYISNALKYGGRPPYIELGADQQDGHLRFWVQDNGQGLTDEQQQVVFDEFSRLDKHANQTEGHGIGLSIVARITEKLGGKAGVESELGKGSQFYFTLLPPPNGTL